MEPPLGGDPQRKKSWKLGKGNQRQRQYLFPLELTDTDNRNVFSPALGARSLKPVLLGQDAGVGKAACPQAPGEGPLQETCSGFGA